MQYSSSRSPASLAPRERVEIALHGGHADYVPFTIYEGMLPQCSVERELRNRGLCIVYRIPVVRTYHPNVKIHQEVFWEDRDREMTRTVYETPVGTLSTLDEAAGFTAWHHEKMFKSPDDYKALLFLINDEVYEPDYEAFAEAEREAGDDAIFRAGFGLEPLQELISGSFMEMQTFCFEWMDRRDEILKLYAALVENRGASCTPSWPNRRPATPTTAATSSPRSSGCAIFQQYYVPHYNEAAEVMHKHGKLIGCHFDANCTRCSPRTSPGTDLDYIEAFTPAPDTDMTLAEARAGLARQGALAQLPLVGPPEAGRRGRASDVVAARRSRDPRWPAHGHHRGRSARPLAGLADGDHGRPDRRCCGAGTYTPRRRAAR